MNWISLNSKSFRLNTQFVFAVGDRFRIIFTIFTKRHRISIYMKCAHQIQAPVKTNTGVGVHLAWPLLSHCTIVDIVHWTIMVKIMMMERVKAIPNWDGDVYGGPFDQLSQSVVMMFGLV